MIGSESSSGLWSEVAICSGREVVQRDEEGLEESDVGAFAAKGEGVSESDVGSRSGEWCGRSWCIWSNGRTGVDGSEWRSAGLINDDGTGGRSSTKGVNHRGGTEFCGIYGVGVDRSLRSSVHRYLSIEDVVSGDINAGV